ncbi:MAG: hypothetical protein JNL71_18185, partial [Rhodospirillales bacterium]|nr:hypothetical protein [Rhodospirillales bacterium]
MPSVTAKTPDGRTVEVHTYAGDALGEDYALEDIVENLAVGRMDGNAFVIERRQLREMETL